MVKVFSLRICAFVVAVFFCVFVTAQDKPSVAVNAKTRQGDKAFMKLEFEKAIGLYKEALESATDTLHVAERIADSYRLLGDRNNAEQWYAKVVDNPKSAPVDKYYYAELLRADRNFTELKNIILAYANASPNHAGLSDAFANVGNLPLATMRIKLRPGHQLAAIGFWPGIL